MRVLPVINQQNQKTNFNKQMSFKATINQAEAATEVWENGHDVFLSLVSSNILNDVKKLLSNHKIDEPVDIKLGQPNPEKHNQTGVYLIDSFLNIPIGESVKEKMIKVSPDPNPSIPNTFGEFLKSVFTERNTPNPDVLEL